MTKKLFALASVTALTGVVAAASAAGCSSTTTVVDDAGSSGSSGEAGKTEAGKTDTGTSSGEDSGPAVCPTTETIDATTFPWKPPTRAPGSCTDNEVDAMISFIEKTPSATFKQLQDSITNAACRDCVFAKETTTWAPIVLNSAGTGVVALNVGGCPAIVSGKDDCGKAIQQWNDCLDEACVDCAEGDSAAAQKCATAANKKACKKAFDDVVGAAACGDAATAQAALDACNKAEDKYTFIGGVRAQCVGLGDGDN